MQITSYEYSLTKLKLYTAKKTTRATRNKIHDNIKHSHSKYCTKKLRQTDKKILPHFNQCYVAKILY